jgi:hypothetical protein
MYAHLLRINSTRRIIKPHFATATAEEIEMSKVISRDLADEMGLDREYTYSYEKLAGRQLQVLIHLSGGYSVSELNSVLEAAKEAEKIVLENAVLLIPSN